jgi:hypothetical protein
VADGGRDRQYPCQLPPTTSADGTLLLLELPGRGIDALGFGSLADEAGFVLPVPSAVAEMWSAAAAQP